MAQNAQTDENNQQHECSEGKSVLLTEGGFVVDLKENDQRREGEKTIYEQTEIKEVIIDTLSEKLDRISTNGKEEDEPSYVSPVPDPYARAIKYMEKHNIMQIFQKLTAEIIYHRPDDPLSHMLEELQKMKKERKSSIPPETPE